MWTIPVLLVVVTLIFLMMRAIGGDPFRHGTLMGMSGEAWVKYGDPKPPSIQSNLERRYGQDLPWYEQYINYVHGLVTFDLGPSLSFRNRTVNDIVLTQAPVSVELGLLAAVWAAAIGVPLGMLAALRAGTWLDAGAKALTSVGLAIPNFLIATMLIYVFSLNLGWLPTSGWYQGWQQKIMPSITLSLIPMAYCARLVRTGMLETLREEYVNAARAKGLRYRRVLTRHVLRNSVIPVITAGGPMIGYLITGSFVVEMVYDVPGIGRYYLASVAARDYPVVMGLTMILATAVITANLVVDVAHTMLDPRIRDVR
ncbi:MAG: oligopeptide transport system permease protein [Gaiellales bacterium]|nr:oligopeptide transport system permease protein [Gaiellales bacterium]